MKPSDLRPGMVLLEHGAGRKTTRVKVTDVGPCPFHRKGVGRTHVNTSNCYDNAVDVHILS